jgi:probable HAF family extracellular repeat protein
LIGEAQTADGSWHIFELINGQMQDMGFLTQYPANLGLNTPGAFTGVMNILGNSHAFVYNVCLLTDLGTLGGATSEGNGINDNSQVVGSSFGANGSIAQPFLWSSSGGMSALAELPGGNGGSANGSNILGQVVGYSSNGVVSERPVLWMGGVPTDLGTPGGPQGSALAINNFGQIVGQAMTSTGVQHATIWQNGIQADLNSLIPAGSGFTYLSQANAINDAGQIVGTGYVGGNLNAFILNPSSPSSPQGTANLSGTVSDDGLPPGAMLTLNWSKVSGPGIVTFSNPSSSVPDVAGVVYPAMTAAAFSAPELMY